MTISDLQKLELRLNQLERSNKKLKTFFILAIVLSLSIVIIGSAKNSDEIVADKITILHKGKPQFSIRAGKYYHEGDSLIISNRSDTDRVKLLLNGPETKLSLFDGEHDIAGVDLFSAKTYCGLHISNRDWNVGKFWVKDGKPTIELFSDKGRPFFKVPK